MEEREGFEWVPSFNVPAYLVPERHVPGYWRRKAEHRRPGRTPWSQEKLAEKFWEKCKKGADGACWNWTASTRSRKNGDKVGKIKRGGKMVAAHRHSWELTNGPVPPGKIVCHHCDNGLCINPDHLFVGTQSDNITDCVQKGRHHNSKLTADDVREIRRLRGEGVRAKDIAPHFGVTLSAIYHACDGRSYAWVS